MPIDAKLLTILGFIIVNFLVLFFVKTRTTTIISLIIAYLAVILFFSISILNYNSFREVTLSFLAYSIVILFLISGNKPIHPTDNKGKKVKNSKPSPLLLTIVSGVFVLFFLLIFSVVKGQAQITEFVRDQKFLKQNAAAPNVIAEALHSQNISTESFFPVKKDDEVFFSDVMNGRKMAKLRSKLSDNFLLKHSSEAIFIICAIIANLLLLESARPEPEEE